MFEYSYADSFVDPVLSLDTRAGVWSLESGDLDWN